MDLAKVISAAMAAAVNAALAAHGTATTQCTECAKTGKQCTSSGSKRSCMECESKPTGTCVFPRRDDGTADPPRPIVLCLHCVACKDASAICVASPNSGKCRRCAKKGLDCVFGPKCYPRKKSTKKETAKSTRSHTKNSRKNAISIRPTAKKSMRNRGGPRINSKAARVGVGVPTVGVLSEEPTSMKSAGMLSEMPSMSTDAETLPEGALGEGPATDADVGRGPGVATLPVGALSEGPATDADVGRRLVVTDAATLPVGALSEGPATDAAMQVPKGAGGGCTNAGAVAHRPMGKTLLKSKACVSPIVEARRVRHLSDAPVGSSPVARGDILPRNSTEESQLENKMTAKKRPQSKRSAKKTAWRSRKKTEAISHTFQSKNTSSSARTRACAVRFAKDEFSKKMPHRIQHQRVKRRSAKRMPVSPKMSRGMVPKILQEKLSVSPTMLRDNVFVLDGGNEGNPRIVPPPGVKWTSLRISDRDLWVMDSKDSSQGVEYRKDNSSMPAFIKVPREEALSFTDMLNNTKKETFCSALRSGLKSQKKSQCPRGKQRIVFTDQDMKYAGAIGAQVRRSSVGVRDATYHKKHMPPEQWDSIAKYVRKAEYFFSKYVDTEGVQHVTKIDDVADVVRMRSTNGDSGPRIYQGIAVGENTFLSVHTDDDTTYSIVTAHVEGVSYTNDDNVVLYFGFPALGIAVPIRPGDLLIFNPQQPHAVSSRCKSNQTVLALSMYIKTACTGGNNNSVELTEEQTVLAQLYDDLKGR